MKTIHVIAYINHMKLLKVSLGSYTHRRYFCRSFSNAFVKTPQSVTWWYINIFISDIGWYIGHMAIYWPISVQNDIR